MTKIIHDYEMNLKNEGIFHFFEKKLLKCIFQCRYRPIFSARQKLQTLHTDLVE